MSYFAPEESVFGVSFFERLETDAKSVSVVSGPEAKDVLESIKANIVSILNTRCGGAQSAPELGLVDFNDATLQSMDLSLRIKLAIKDCLNQYEPRLTDVEVRALPDCTGSLTLQFHISAAINSDAIHDKVQFGLLLGQNRKYQVL